jgi:murein DD-endopeptidase MepM/ murein hydrolase activator NlpD
MLGKVLALSLITGIALMAFSAAGPTAAGPAAAQDGTGDALEGQVSHLVLPGDTWTALAWRYGVDEQVLRAANPQPNAQMQPAIGRDVAIPGPAQPETTGVLLNSDDGGLLGLSSALGANPWRVAILNGLPHPYRPLLYRPIFIPGGSSPPVQLPVGISDLEVSRAPALPGRALAIRGLDPAEGPLTARFAGQDMVVSSSGSNFVALTGTGAFFAPGQYSLEIAVAGQPLWTQPWLVAPGQWTFEQITYTGQAATIDAETIRLERERLAAIWSQVSPQPYWSGDFAEPLLDYLAYSSLYGARRSYSGGPYDRYHEGLDFSAYGGTAVYAPASGQVVLAEPLDARGGAIIIDHGLGVFSGYYHLSEVLAEPGQVVAAGDLLGRVGSTGLSTGNHLHWDLLVAGIWVDPAAWREDHMACWLLEGLGQPCLPS